jgi:hypothetical protein
MAAPGDSGVLLVDPPLQVLCVQVGSGVDVPVGVAASGFGLLIIRTRGRWTIAAFWARPGREMKPLGIAMHGDATLV